MDLLNIIMYKMGPSFMAAPLMFSLVFILKMYAATRDAEVIRASRVQRGLTIDQATDGEAEYLQGIMVSGGVFLAFMVFVSLAALVSLYSPGVSFLAHLAVFAASIFVVAISHDIETDDLEDSVAELTLLFLIALGAMYLTRELMFSTPEEVRAALQAL